MRIFFAIDVRITVTKWVRLVNAEREIDKVLLLQFASGSWFSP